MSRQWLSGHASLFLAVLLIAGCARYYRLGEVPRGLFLDEAADGIDAAQAAREHHYRVFYPDDAGREGLWINLMSLSVSRLGPTRLAARFWAPIAGLMAVVLLYLLARQWFGPRVAVLSSWFLATSFWHINFSRLAFRAILVPLFLTATLYFLQRSWGEPGRRAVSWAVIGGAIFGLGFYSYIAFRVVPVLIALLVAYSWYRKGVPRRHLFRVTAYWLAATFVTALPIGLYFLRNPQDFSNRISQVSVWSGPRPVITLLRSAVRTLEMFNFRGDCNWRQNLPCSPELLFPVGLLFLLGLWVALAEIRRHGRPFYAALLLWLLVLLAPAFLTRESVPHALRSIGALPAAMITAAVGANWLLVRSAKRKALSAVIVVVVVLSGAMDLYRYFFVWARSPELDNAFMYEYFETGRRLAGLPPDAWALIAVDEPGVSWRATGIVHTNPDGQSVLLPPAAAVPIYASDNRPNTTYLLSGQVARAKLWNSFHCRPSPPCVPPLKPIAIKGCDKALILIRLPS